MSNCGEEFGRLYQSAREDYIKKVLRNLNPEVHDIEQLSKCPHDGTYLWHEPESVQTKIRYTEGTGSKQWRENIERIARATFDQKQQQENIQQLIATARDLIANIDDKKNKIFTKKLEKIIAKKEKQGPDVIVTRLTSLIEKIKIQLQNPHGFFAIVDDALEEAQLTSGNQKTI